MITLGYILTYTYILFLLIICEVLKKKVNTKEYLTRKIIHIGVSFVFVIFYIFFKSTYHILIPPITFIILNYISYKKDIFKSMEESKSLGTVYYALSIFIMCIITYIKNDFYPYFGLGVYTMAFADAFASILGKRYGKKKIYKNKTYVGSLTMFITSFIVLIMVSMIFNLNINIISFILVPLSAMILELLGKEGLDNIYVPLGVSILAYILGGL